MAKKKKKTEEAVIEIKPLVITAAAIKDDFCNYAFEVKSGIGIGDVVKVSGKGVIDDDLRDAFMELGIHLAIVDDVFKHLGTAFSSISDLKGHPMAYNYRVTGFKIKGSEEKESVILVGTKDVECSNGEMSLESPAIPLDSLSSYKWVQELKDAVDHARTEVELYRGGKYTVVENEPKEDPNQLTIAAGGDDFEEGRLE